MFVQELKNTLNEEYNVSVTENGMIGYRTSGKELLDLNFAVASLRFAEDEEICNRFIKAFYEDKMAAMKWLFFARDVREGLGERRLFRTVMSWLAGCHPDVARAVIDLVPEYGRWDDLWCLLDKPLFKKYVMQLVSNQLAADHQNKLNNKGISLLAKWLPSTGASSRETKRLAKIIVKELGITEKEYRKLLSEYRKYLDVIEIKMSTGKWSKIDYNTVPSRANLIYSNAFMRHDEERRRAYLSALERGEAKINSSVLYPHDIVHRYTKGALWNIHTKPLDSALEEMWNALPDLVNGNDNTIVVADGSGSMYTPVGGTQVTALSVANALAIYFSEKSSGQFKDKYITFSETPQLVDFSKCKTLKEKIEVALAHNEVTNTNIEAVFNLILDTAVKNNMSQDDIPKNILIISDMQFDMASSYNHYPDQRLFTKLTQQYMAAGYKMPRLIFWNVNSRTGTIPIKENELGVALVSGFSVNICKMVLSGELDPYKCLIEIINTERYQPIEDAIKNII